MSKWTELHLRHEHHQRFPQVEIGELSPSVILTTMMPSSQERFLSPKPQVPIFNFSSDEVKDLEELQARNISATSMDAVYTMAVPVMGIFCLLTVVVNLVIVVSAKWCRKPMSPTLYFSISLALADAYFTLLVGIGLILNSFLPNVYKIYLTSDCFNLMFEVFRLGGILVANIHLLALAINHWIGIVRPLHYAATMTRRTAWTVILSSWILPILLIFGIFSAWDGIGFRSQGCHQWQFLEERTFRGIFASLFFTPLLLMSLIYVHIFIIVRNHQNQRLRYQNSVQLQRNVKAVMTTVLILGTYILGFLPANLFNIVVCTDCIVTFEEVHPSVMVSWGILVNTLVILKALVDPIIYAARMADIQAALKKMRYDVLKTCCGACVAPSTPEFERRFSTMYVRSQSQKTNSIRASSFGSNASWKRLSTNCPNPQYNSLRQGSRRQPQSQSLIHKQFPKENGTLLEMTHLNQSPPQE